MITLNGVEMVAVFVQSRIVVIGQDPEGADMDNPRGNIYGTSAYVVVEDAEGRRWAHERSFVARWTREAEAAANKLCRRVEAANGALDPTRWTQIEAAYYSPARDFEEEALAERWSDMADMME